MTTRLPEPRTACPPGMRQAPGAVTLGKPMMRGLEYLRFGTVILLTVVALVSPNASWRAGDLAWMIGSALVILGLMASADRLVSRTRLMAVSLLGQAVVVAGLVLRLPGYWDMLWFVVAGQTMFFLSGRSAMVVVGLVWVVQSACFALSQLAQGTLNLGDTVFNALGMGAGLVFFALTGYLAVSQAAERKRAEDALAALQVANAELAQAHRQLTEYAREIEELAAARERNKLAQEIHDALAHTFTSLILQLESCSRQLKVDPEQASQTVERVLVSARQGLTEVRKSVRSIYPEAAGTVDVAPGLARLAEEFSADTGIEVHLLVNGEARPVSAAAGKAVHRTLQEALTNAGRHGGATKVDVILSFGRDRTQLVVSDNGKGADNPTEGFGLRGMRERSVALSGSFRVETSPGQGFSLTMVLPA